MPNNFQTKKKKAAITSANMKYKIQNHFAHNDAQVFHSQKCISVFIFHVPNANDESVNQKETENVLTTRKRGKTEKKTHLKLTAKFSSQRLDCNGLAKVCRSLETVCWLSTRN